MNWKTYTPKKTFCLRNRLKNKTCNVLKSLMSPKTATQEAWSQLTQTCPPVDLHIEASRIIQGQRAHPVPIPFPKIRLFHKHSQSEKHLNPSPPLSCWCCYQKVRFDRWRIQCNWSAPKEQFLSKRRTTRFQRLSYRNIDDFLFSSRFMF